MQGERWQPTRPFAIVCEITRPISCAFATGGALSEVARAENGILRGSPKVDVRSSDSRPQPLASGYSAGIFGTAGRIVRLDWTDGQIRNNDDDATEIRDVNLTAGHVLSGPIAITGAEPGDILVVEILDIGAWPTAGDGHEPWGYTGIFAPGNGVGFLTDLFPEACGSVTGIVAWLLTTLTDAGHIDWQLPASCSRCLWAISL